MLPNLHSCHGQHVFSFDQSIDFPVNLAHTTRLGACSGLSLHWIKMHKLRQQALFCSTIMRPSSIRDIENYQSIDPLSDVVYARTLAVTGLIPISAREIQRSFITPNLVSETIANMPSGYQMLSFCNNSGQHTIALAVASTINDNLYDLNYGSSSFKSVDFFDPNYGCATFDNLENFKSWFKFFYWSHPGGPGGNGVCREFIMSTFM